MQTPWRLKIPAVVVVEGINISSQYSRLAEPLVGPAEIGVISIRSWAVAIVTVMTGWVGEMGSGKSFVANLSRRLAVLDTGNGEEYSAREKTQVGRKKGEEVRGRWTWERLVMVREKQVGGREAGGGVNVKNEALREGGREEKGVQE